MPSVMSTILPGVYRQADGEPILWNPLWAAFEGTIDQPNGGTAENCLAVHLLGNVDAGKWFDHFCTAPYHYICERA